MIFELGRIWVGVDFLQFEGRGMVWTQRAPCKGFDIVVFRPCIGDVIVSLRQALLVSVSNQVDFLALDLISRSDVIIGKSTSSSQH